MRPEAHTITSIRPKEGRNQMDSSTENMPEFPWASCLTTGSAAQLAKRRGAAMLLQGPCYKLAGTTCFIGSNSWLLTGSSLSSGD